MDRRNFILRISARAASALAITSLSGCLSDPQDPQNTVVDFTLDLSALPQLTKAAGFLIKDNVLLARTLSGDYVAATLICSHEQQPKVVYESDKNQFHCTAHDARFDASGKGLNNNGRKNLTVYSTELNDNSLHVFS